MTRAIWMLGAAGLLAVLTPAPPVRASLTPKNGLVRTYWPNGRLRTEISYRNDLYEGIYRAWSERGTPFQIRHYAAGHEEGLQQEWTEAGKLYVNYEARNGRHYGMENSTPCEVAGKPNGQTTVPYFDDARLTPHWSSVSHRVADFRLTTQTGKTVTARDLCGGIHVASFIYTQCAAVCPLLVRQLSRLQEATQGMADVRIVSYSVTPETDSPRALAAFGRDRGIDANKWWLLTGDRAQIYQLARQSYFADDDRVQRPDAIDEFLHTEKVVLVDAGGHLRGIYNGTQPFQIDQLLGDIMRLRSESAPH